ncbi:predicted protein, partial [Postia placenta Mad-698-R]
MAPSKKSAPKAHKCYVAASTSKKRPAEQLSDAEESAPRKVAKGMRQHMYPIFEKPSERKAQQNSTFKWIWPALGPKATCLHGVNLQPESRTKVAAFDLDGCLIGSSFGKKSKSGAPPEFQWWRPSIPTKLKEVYDEG